MEDEKDMGKKEASASGEEADVEAGQEIQELPEEEIARLRTELEAKAKEAGENYSRFLRACADLDNYKKRLEREKAEIKNFACEEIASGILPVVDNLERALEHSEGGHNNIEALKEGVRLTIDQMASVLKKFGLEEIKSLGERFDPSLHHAISHEEGSGEGADIVTKVFQKGYTLKGRLLRPSMVAVGKDAAPAVAAKEKAQESGREGGAIH